MKSPPKFPKSISDVFFPDAREKLVGPRPEKRAGTAAPTDVVGNNPSAETSPEGVEGGQGWNRLITPEAIEDEIKAQQIKLSKTIQSATKFKGGEHQSARLHFSVLAMLFAIDAQYDQKMRWQREAPAMRDLMARAGFNCKVGTDASFAEAKARADELENLVRGNAVQLPEAAADPNWAKVADRQPLMKRLEQVQKEGLAPWTASAAEFTRHGDKLSHEAQLMAAIAEVIGRDGYEYSDDDTYRELAKAMQTQALEVRNAVGQKNYEGARQAAGKVNKACSSCHEGFRS